MAFPVFIEPIPGVGFRAGLAAPFATSAEGATPEEAVERLKRHIEQRLAGGGRIVALELPGMAHQWSPFAGMYSNQDPIILEWLQTLKEQGQTAETDA